MFSVHTIVFVSFLILSPFTLIWINLKTEFSPRKRIKWFPSTLSFSYRFQYYYMDESVLLGTKPLVDSIRHSIRDPSGVFSVWHACECHIAHWRHDSRHFYFVEWTWFLVSFRFVVSKHRQAGLICLIKRRKRMSFQKTSRTRTW